MEPEGSLPHSQVPATCPYPEPDQSSPHAHTSHFLNIYLHIILPLMSGSSKLSLCLQISPPKLCIHFQSPSPHIRATFPIHFIIPDFITRTIFGEQFRSFCSSLWSFIHSRFTSSLLGPNTLLNTQFQNILSQHSSFHVSDQVSNPYKTGEVTLCLSNTLTNAHI